MGDARYKWGITGQTKTANLVGLTYQNVYKRLAELEGVQPDTFQVLAGGQVLNPSSSDVYGEDALLFVKLLNSDALAAARAATVNNYYLKMRVFYCGVLSKPESVYLKLRGDSYFYKKLVEAIYAAFEDGRKSLRVVEISHDGTVFPPDMAARPEHIDSIELLVKAEAGERPALGGVGRRRRRATRSPSISTRKGTKARGKQRQGSKSASRSRK